MNFEQLRYFVETAKQQHVGKAAKILGISASAISHSVAHLEEELGILLFDRKGKSIYLTSRGQMLLIRAEKMLGEISQLKEEMSGAEVHFGNYTLAATHGVAARSLAPAWATLSKQYPKISVDLISLRSADVIASVINREVDFGLCFSPQKHPELSMHFLQRGRLVIAVRKNHPFNRKKTSSIAELSNYPAVLPKAFQGVEVCEVDPIFKRLNLVPKARTRVDSYEVMMRIIEETDSWGFIPEQFVLNQPKIEVLSEGLSTSSFHEVAVIYRKDRFVPQFFLDLIDEVQKNI